VSHSVATMPRVSIRQMSKTFGSTRALRGLDLDLRGGEVHALCGQNGSGKSTLIKILSAYYEPDEGAELALDGISVPLPLQAGHGDALGIRVVHQDLGLALGLSVLDNLYIDGYPTGRGGLVAWRAARKSARELLSRFHLDVPLSAIVATLNPAERAMLAIARAMHPGDKAATRLLILDEPTAHLPKADVELLMRALQVAKDNGVAILIVTHRLSEVLDYADRATVLRDGVNVGTLRGGDLQQVALVELMLGRKLDNQYPHVARQHDTELLTVRGLSVGRATAVDLTLHEGEILGVTGLVGSGFEDLPYGIFSASDSRGAITYAGETVAWRRPQDAIDAGVALIPAERIGQAGVSNASLLENATLPSMRSRMRGPLIDRVAETRFVSRILQDYDVRPAGGVERPLGSLSGGNQQKILLAKWLEMQPRVILLHEPTQGVDIGSRRQIFEFLVDAAGRGAGILFASADQADLVNLCHRVLVFSRGSVVAELSGNALTEERIAELSLRDSLSRLGDEA
jgi:ribose transport system ATP-binding protein